MLTDSAGHGAGLSNSALLDRGLSFPTFDTGRDRTRLQKCIIACDRLSKCCFSNVCVAAICLAFHLVCELFGRRSCLPPFPWVLPRTWQDTSPGWKHQKSLLNGLNIERRDETPPPHRGR